MEITERIDKLLGEVGLNPHTGDTIDYAGDAKMKMGKKRNNKKVEKAWKDFEKIAKKELGPDWDGKVSGDMIYGDGLSDKAKKLYKKYFNLL